MPDTATTTSALTPGVALTSAVIYWANLQARLNAVSSSLRALNAEIRGLVEGAPRAASIAKQTKVFLNRTRALHDAVVMSVVTLVAFLISSGVVFVAPHEWAFRRPLARGTFIVGLLTFGVSLAGALWEMLLARAALDEDVATSAPRPRPQDQ